VTWLKVTLRNLVYSDTPPENKQNDTALCEPGDVIGVKGFDPTKPARDSWTTHWTTYVAPEGYEFIEVRHGIWRCTADRVEGQEVES
jgi:hypothetical protein